MRLRGYLLGFFFALMIGQASANQDELRETVITEALYASPFTENAVQSNADAALLKAWRQIKALRKNPEISAQERMTATQVFLRSLHDEDADYARAIAPYRAALDTVSQWPNGPQAILQFNEGEHLAAIATLDGILAQLPQPQGDTAKEETAQRKRHVAQFALQKYYSGKISAKSILPRIDEITKLDPTQYWDWLALHAIHRDLDNTLSTRLAAKVMVLRAPTPLLKAFALTFVGQTYLDSKRPSQARPFYDEALGMFRDAAGEDGLATSDSGDDLAYGLHLMAELAHKEGNTVDAKRLYQEALEFSHRLAEKWPEDYSLRRTLISSFYASARLHRELKEFDAALTLVDGSIAQTRSLMAQEPEWDLPLLDISSDYVLRAEILKAQKNLDAAQAAYEEALSYLRRAVAASPDSDWRKAMLLFTLADLGEFLKSRGNFRDALPIYLEARDIAVERVAADPSSNDRRRTLIYLLWVLAEDFPDSGVRWEEVAAQLEELDRRGLLNDGEKQILKDVRARALEQNRGTAMEVARPKADHSGYSAHDFPISRPKHPAHHLKWKVSRAQPD